MMDDVPSKVTVLLVESVQSCVMAPELQEDWLGTKDEIGSSNVHLNNSKLHLNLVPQGISWSRHQNCKRMSWYKSDQYKFMSIKSISEFLNLYNSRIARGVPLPVYMNLDLYSGFWCTSRCVVF